MNYIPNILTRFKNPIRNFFNKVFWLDHDFWPKSCLQMERTKITYYRKMWNGF